MTGPEIEVCHFRPGSSKWNKVEHRLFLDRQNWRSKPLISHEVTIELIAATTTTTGLQVVARIDPINYPKDVKVTDAQLAAINITRHPWHREWNYLIAPSGPAR